MGFETIGFAGGRVDVWEPQTDVNWGVETEMLADKRYSGNRELDNPLAAVQMGLIYVNPEGPNGKPDPMAAAKDIRETFGRMAMNDVETVALIAGGHTFGKAHGAATPEGHVGPDPEAAPLEEQGLGWKNTYGSGHGKDTITSGLEGAWTSTPAEWSHGYFANMFRYKWELTKSPAGAWQWTPTDPSADGTVPDAHDDSVSHAPIMFTTDLALATDPAYKVISKRFHQNPDEFKDAFAKAWFKLTHRDMGPVSRYLGSDVPKQQFLWQDPVPTFEGEIVDDSGINDLKKAILDSGLSVSDLVATAWASASSFRQSDNRGGANGGRVRLAPQKDWAANNPRRLKRVLTKLADVQTSFNRDNGAKISMADLIVLGGCAAIDSAAKKAGLDINVPFVPGRTDATAGQTDVENVAVLEPQADGFRNYIGREVTQSAEALLIDRAQQLNLSAPEMTALIGGLRVLGANSDDLGLGVLTKNPGTLSNDFFVNLLSMDTKWSVSPICEHFFEGRDRATDELKWKASKVDLLFGSHSQLRAIAEVYASKQSEQKFVNDFVDAWTKVMTLDRFDLR